MPLPADSLPLSAAAQPNDLAYDILSRPQRLGGYEHMYDTLNLEGMMARIWELAL